MSIVDYDYCIWNFYNVYRKCRNNVLSGLNRAGELLIAVNKMYSVKLLDLKLNLSTYHFNLFF